MSNLRGMKANKATRRLFYGRTILIATLATAIITILLVFFTGLESHRSVINNALISLSILAAAFLIFLSTGLYYGVQVVDNLKGKFKLRWGNTDTWSPPVIADVDMDIENGCLGGILAWIVAALVSIILLFFLQTIVWAAFAILIGAIYWVLIRALKLIFSRSCECKGQLGKSLSIALTYTVLYIGWIYGIIYISSLF